MANPEENKINAAPAEGELSEKELAAAAGGGATAGSLPISAKPEPSKGSGGGSLDYGKGIELPPGTGVETPIP